MTEQEMAQVRADFEKKLKESMALAKKQAEDAGKAEGTPFGRWVCGVCKAPVKENGMSIMAPVKQGYWAPKRIQGTLSPLSKREMETRGRMGQLTEPVSTSPYKVSQTADHPHTACMVASR